MSFDFYVKEARQRLLRDMEQHGYVANPENIRRFLSERWKITDEELETMRSEEEQRQSPNPSQQRQRVMSDPPFLGERTLEMRSGAEQPRSPNPSQQPRSPNPSQQRRSPSPPVSLIGGWTIDADKQLEAMRFAEEQRSAEQSRIFSLQRQSPSPSPRMEANESSTMASSAPAPAKRRDCYRFNTSLYKTQTPPVQSLRTVSPYMPFQFIDDGTNVLTSQNIETLLRRSNPTQFNEEPICHISTKYFEDTLTHLQTRKSLDAANFVLAFKGLLAMRYFKWEGKCWYFGADYSLIEEKDIVGYCKSSFEKSIQARPGVKFENSFLDAIPYRKIISVDARDSLDPCWLSGNDGIFAEIPRVPLCTFQSMSVPQPSRQVSYCCDEMAGFLYHHMCGGDDVTFKVVANFFLATILGIKVDIMLFLYGPKGTGKSTLINILRHMVGENLYEQISVDKFSNSGYVKGKTFIAVHEAENPKIQCLTNMKERVTDPRMSHNGEHFNCTANFIFCSNQNNCEELLSDRRCFSIYLDKKPTVPQIDVIRTFTELIETNPEVVSVFYDRLHSYARDTIGNFVGGVHLWLLANEIVQQRRGSCVDNDTVTENQYNPFHVNNLTNDAIKTLFEYVQQNATSKSNKKIQLPTTINEKLSEEILNVVKSLDISITNVRDMDVVPSTHLELALLRLVYPQMMASNGALVRRVAALENTAGAQPANQPLYEDTDATTTYTNE